MKTNDQQIKNDWDSIDYKNIDTALSFLRRYEGDVRTYLASCVASVCNINTEDMFSNTDVIYYAHARWLYWYAYRYMTNESYEKIANDTKEMGHFFVQRSIQGGVTKMMTMIEREPLWKKRWSIIKNIILQRDANATMKDNTIVIQVPKEVQDKVKIEIKTK